MIRWYSRFLLVFFLCSSSVDPTDDHATQEKGFATSSHITLTELFNEATTTLRAKSAHSTTRNVVGHNCTSPCVAQLSFDDPFKRPSACSSRIISGQCVAQIEMNFNDRTISLLFKTNGNEYASDSFQMLAAQIVTYTFNTNQTIYAITFACFIGDDCDWNYLSVTVNRFLRSNFPSFFNVLRPLLYDASNPVVSQCYVQNNPSACNNGACAAIVQDSGSARLNRSCVTTPSNTEINVIRARLYPGPTDFDQSYSILVCNRNLCNDPTTEQTLRNISAANASLFEIPSPSNGFCRTADSGKYLAVLLIFVQWL